MSQYSNSEENPNTSPIDSTTFRSLKLSGRASEIERIICGRGGFIIQRHNELRDLEAEMLNVMCHNVEVEQEITGEVLPRGSNRGPDARLDNNARGSWARQGSAFFDAGVCHPNAESYKDLFASFARALKDR